MVDRGRLHRSCRCCNICIVEVQREKPVLQQVVGHFQGYRSRIFELLPNGEEMALLCIYGDNMDPVLDHGGQHDVGCAIHGGS